MINADAAHEGSGCPAEHGSHFLVETRAVHAEVLRQSFYSVVRSGEILLHKAGGTVNQFVVNGLTVDSWEVTVGS